MDLVAKNIASTSTTNNHSFTKIVEQMQQKWGVKASDYIQADMAGKLNCFIRDEFDFMTMVVGKFFVYDAAGYNGSDIKRS